MANSYKICRGDVGHRMSFVISKPDKSLWTMETAKMLMFGGNEYTALERNCTVDGPGLCHYDNIVGDFIVSGEFTLRIKFTTPDGKTITTKDCGILEILEVA